MGEPSSRENKTGQGDVDIVWSAGKWIQFAAECLSRLVVG
jgi:hypothetical protein